MEAGIELNILIHKKVFGYKGRIVDKVFINDRWWHTPTWLEYGDTPEKIRGGMRVGYMPPDYSRDIKLAERVIEKIFKLYPGASVRVSGFSGSWLVKFRTFNEKPHCSGEGYSIESLSHAICHAALDLLDGNV